MDELNYRHLLYFWTVAREGSIARASRRLGVTEPTISGQIHELEESLGRKLFTRAGRGLTLTESGRTICPYAEQIFELGGRMLAAARQEQPPEKPELHLGVANGLPAPLVAQIVQPVIAGDPAARLKSSADHAGQFRVVVRRGENEHLLAELAGGRIEMLLTAAAPGTSKGAIATHLLGSSEVAWFAPASLAAAVKRGFPRSLAKSRLFLPTDGPVRRAVERWIARTTLEATIAGEFEDLELLALSASAGNAVFPALAVQGPRLAEFHKVTMVGRLPAFSQRFYACTASPPSRPALLLIEAARAWLGKRTKPSHRASACRKPT